MKSKSRFKSKLEQLCFPDELLRESPILVIHHSSKVVSSPKIIDDVLDNPKISFDGKGIFLWLFNVKSATLEKIFETDRETPQKILKSAVGELVSFGYVKYNNGLVELIDGQSC